MAVFGSYARYYDLLYRDKDYEGEAKIVADIIQAHAPEARSMLELGCGTGGHAQHFASFGYQVHGVDRSDEMLKGAANRCAKLSPDVAERLAFSRGDVRTVRVGRTFDVVASLFHVVSYQTTNQDLTDMFVTAREHLAPGGIMVFDFWYGPAVLTSRPEVRVKRLGDDETLVTRVAEPVMDSRRSLVDVNYTMFVQDKAAGRIDQFGETHVMRYLFENELEILLAGSGLKARSFFEWGTNRTPDFSTWSVCCVAGK